MGTRKVNGRMVDEVVFPLGTAAATTGRCFLSTATVTRPANQSPYGIGDVVGDGDGNAAIPLTLAGPPGGFIEVETVWLFIHSASIPTSMNAGPRLHMYSAAPQAIADNAAWDLVAADRGSYVGFVDLGAPADFGSTVACWASSPGRKIKLPAGSTDLWAYLTTSTAATFAENSTVLELRVQTVERG